MHARASKGAQKSGSSHAISFLFHAGEGWTARLGEDSQCRRDGRIEVRGAGHASTSLECRTKMK
jgi:hypothetical protein